MKPDVYAAANTQLPDALYGEKLVERPVVFAGNRLVIAVPAGSDRVGSVEDLSGPEVSVAAGAASVPVGSYTRQVLSRLRPATERAILANVRSNEPDVKGVVAKLIQGAADAGFVYVTDVGAAKGKLKAIELPESLRPERGLRCCGREGSEGARGRAGVHRRPPRRRGSRAMRQAGFERPAMSGGAFTALLVVVAGRGAHLPTLPAGGDLRGRRPRPS